MMFKNITSDFGARVLEIKTYQLQSNELKSKKATLFLIYCLTESSQHNEQKSNPTSLLNPVSWKRQESYPQAYSDFDIELCVYAQVWARMWLSFQPSSRFMGQFSSHAHKNSSLLRATLSIYISLYCRMFNYKNKIKKNQGSYMKMKTFLGQLVARFGIRRVKTHWVCNRPPFSLFRKALGGQQEPPLLAIDIRFPVPELHRIPFMGYKAQEKTYYPVKNSVRYQLCWKKS